MSTLVPATSGACFVIFMIAVYAALLIYLLVLATRFVKAFESLARSAARAADKYSAVPPETLGGGPVTT